MIRAQHKPSRVIDRKYREFVKTHHCTLSSMNCSGPIDPHHVIPIGGGKMGSKVSDRRCIPLCRNHHDLVGKYADNYREAFEHRIETLNAKYDTLYPVKRETRQRQTVAKVKIEHCICGKPHTLSFSKCSIVISSETVEFRCPTSNKECEARL